ncbi:MAG TPA: ribonuclease HII [Candidatus Cloacimonadota bacterium]|nr:ribonuclease HII [Candidatus Cloacimonadota bacterium]
MPDIVENPLVSNDRALNQSFLAGIDEAGRGALAGPVVVAAVILTYTHPLTKLNDSKKLSAKQRELLYEEILADALAYDIAVMDHELVDEINVLKASLQGMKQALDKLSPMPEKVLIDGPYVPNGMDALAVVKGDGKHACIAAASILAKVTRDRMMQSFAELYPHYGFDRNKGYGSAIHLKALSVHGPCPIHRKTYSPVSQLSIWPNL